MKNSNLLYFLIFITTLLLTSCTSKEDLTPYSSETNTIEEIASYEKFLEIDKTPELHTLNFDEKEISKNTTSNAKTDICEVCNPRISSINVYNLGGNERGFSVNTVRNHPCDYRITWGSSSPNVTYLWKAEGFARVRFPGPGTYNIQVHFISGIDDYACLVADQVTVTIPYSIIDRNLQW